jgi:hypothetical protein
MNSIYSEMKAFKNVRIVGLATLILLALLACKKEKDDLPAPQNPGTSGTPTGSMTADINGSSFQAQELKARIGTNGSLTMFGISDDYQLDFRIAAFGGAISHNLHPTSNNEVFVITPNGVFTSNESGNGSLVITEYSETNYTISGTFEIVAGMIDAGGNAITVSDGVFTNVPLTKLPDPEIGQALYIANGNIIEPDGYRVHITDHYRFVVDIESGGMRWRYHTYADPTVNPPNYSSGIMLQQHLMNNWMFVVGNNPQIEITEYNEEEGFASGRIYLTQIDFDVKFNRIPLFSPTQVEPGQVVLNTPDGSITFGNAAYTFLWDIDAISLEATNANNQKITVEASYEFGDNEPDHLYGRGSTMRFFEDANGPPTYTKYGYWKHYTGSPGLHIGFVSFDEEFSVKGFHVPN